MALFDTYFRFTSNGELLINVISFGATDSIICGMDMTRGIPLIYIENDDNHASWEDFCEGGKFFENVRSFNCRFFHEIQTLPNWPNLEKVCVDKCFDFRIIPCWSQVKMVELNLYFTIPYELPLWPNVIYVSLNTMTIDNLPNWPKIEMIGMWGIEGSTTIPNWPNIMILQTSMGWLHSKDIFIISIEEWNEDILKHKHDIIYLVDYYTRSAFIIKNKFIKNSDKFQLNVPRQGHIKHGLFSNIYKMLNYEIIGYSSDNWQEKRILISQIMNSIYADPRILTVMKDVALIRDRCFVEKCGHVYKILGQLYQYIITRRVVNKWLSLI